MIAAVVVMFDNVNSNGVDPSIYIVRTVVFCVLVLAFISFIYELAYRCTAYRPQRYATTVSMIQNLLLTLWASFMASRTFLPLDSPARDSEVLFYLLNIAPLVIIGMIPTAIRREPNRPLINVFSSFA
ncbi:hypothetical protein GGH92_001766 [Coemansia sp. RSA 2673]|nr:hypothetical protein GGH92_001766 [Coemansia sp. RSA 2673]